jgi:hypothetical protein
VRTDVFLTHNWGLNGSNHQRVSLVNRALQEGDDKLSTWFDEERLHGDINEQMVEGIDNARVLVVFLTEEYQRKINTGDRRDNCKFEFKYAFRTKGESKMVVVVMEPALLDTRNWTGLLSASLGGLLYVDMTKDPISREKIDELKRLIRVAMRK